MGYIEKELGTSVEEDKANTVNFAAVKEREEEATLLNLHFGNVRQVGDFRERKTGTVVETSTK